MRFGLHSGGPDIATIRARWQEADRLGFYACSMADHPLWHMLETWTVFAAAAAFTTRLRLCLGLALVFVLLHGIEPLDTIRLFAEEVIPAFN
ncbi:MAG: LLM class flavin-dependent oxidoreductase [Armatimonadota bacterium]|nr:LLM class flavin-dependent oxidoreductase [Armatimonadota bacterium]